MVIKHFKCPACKMVSPAGQWNMTTENAIKAAHKSVKSLMKQIQYAKQTPHRAYKCPLCHEFSTADRIEGVKYHGKITD